MVSVSRRESDLSKKRGDFFLTESKRVSRGEWRVLAVVKRALSQWWSEQAGVLESTVEG